MLEPLIYLSVTTEPQSAALVINTDVRASRDVSVIERKPDLGFTSTRSATVTVPERTATSSQFFKARTGLGPGLAQSLTENSTGSTNMVRTIVMALPIDEDDEAALRRLTEATVAKSASRHLRRR